MWVCADVFVCTCAHGCGILKFCLRGKSVGLPHAPGQCSPTGEGGGSACGCVPAGRLASPAHPALGILFTSAPCDFKRGDSTSRLLQLSVCGTETHPGLLGQLCGCTQRQSPWSQPCWQTSTSITPWCSETAERGLLCLVHVTEGWSQRLGQEMVCLLFKKMISSMHSAAWAGSKVIVPLSLLWVSLRAHASCFFPACSGWMLCFSGWPEQPS